MIKISKILLEKTGIKAPSKVLPEINYHIALKKSNFSNDSTFHAGTLLQAIDRACGDFYYEREYPFPYYLHKVKIKEGLEIIDFVFDHDPEDLNDDNSKWDEYDSNKVAYYINAVEGSTTNRNYFTLGYGGFCKKAVKPSNENFSLITDGKNVSIESVTKINSFEELKKLVDSVCGPNDHKFIDYEK
jgi:hypothetical protein